MPIVRPFIETLREDPKSLRSFIPSWEINALIDRKDQSKHISNHIRDGKSKEACEDALVKIMENYPRIALYIPFDILKNAEEDFREAYLDAWRKCWAYHDIAETFNIGDILEKGSYIGEPRRVVKAMHLIPWLVQYQYLTIGDIVQIMRFMRNDEVLSESLFEAALYMRQNNQISSEEYEQIAKFKALPHFTYEGFKQIYETSSRRKWLEDKERNYGVTSDFKLRNPTGPFSKNISEKDLAQIPQPEEGKYYLVGGSRLKGYGRIDSDYDVYEYDVNTGIIKGFEPYAGNPGIIAHLIYNTAWIGLDKDDTAWMQYHAAFGCIRNQNSQARHDCLIRMEMDLLQFRLMHKGIICAYPELFKDLPDSSSIDIKSAFYQDVYRKIAVQLYAKYIILPEDLK